MSARRAITILLPLLVAVGLVGAVQVPAGASHRDQANSGHLNTGTWRVCVYAPGQGGSAASTGISRVNATAVNASETCSNANVSFNALSYPDGWYGNTICSGTLTGTTCTYKTVYLNLRVAETAQQRRKTSTHELGHVGGLGHRTTNASVMTQGASPPVSEFYDDHDVQALANQY
jgi:hypothetical protein